MKRTAEQRGETYRRLADFFFEIPENKAFPETIAGEEIEDWQEFLDAYQELIFGCGTCFLPLWESACIAGSYMLLDENTLRVKTLMREHGVKAAVALHMPEDYIGVELAFMGYLGETGKPEDFAAQKSFLQEHLLPFSSCLCKEMEKVQGHAGFPAFFRGLNRFLQEDYLALNQDLTPFPKQASAKLSTISAWLEPAAPVTSKEQVIMTVGRGNCGGRCIIRSHVVDGCVLSLSTDESDGSDGLPVLKACSKGHSYRKNFLTPQRIRYPMKRVGERGEGKFVRISWEEAVDTIAEQTRRVRETYGPGARYVNYASGINAVLRGNLFAKRLLSLDGGFLDSYNTYSAACTEQITPYIYGTCEAGSTINTLDQSGMILLWGFNPAESMYNGELLAELRKAKERKIPIIVVDPRYSDTAATFATGWVGLKPTTDGALAAGMAYVILEKKLEDRAFLDRFCLGFDREHMPEESDVRDNYQDYVLGTYDQIPKTPEWASRITGVPRETIEELAVLYATTKPAALIPGLGPQRHGNGEQTVRATAILACMTGNVGIEGGYAGASCYIVQHPWPAIPVPKNPYPGVISCFLWTDAITRGNEMNASEDGVRGMDKLETPIKLIYNLAGNTLINQHSDCNATDKILRDTNKCEFIVVSDLFMTSSARYADILLPGASMFETCNLNLPWREGNFLLCSNQAIPTFCESRVEYDWLKEVADRLGIGEAFRDGKETSLDWQRDLYESIRPMEPELPVYEEFDQNGGHKYRHQPRRWAFEEQVKEPENHPFPTPSGKIELYSHRLKQLGVIPPIPVYVPSFEGPEDPLAARYPIQLIGWHNKFHTHSVFDNNEWMEDIDSHVLWMHPEDAAQRKLEEGNLAAVFNDRGEIRLPVHITRRIVKGVAAMPQGGWYQPDGKKIDKRCINTVTTLRPTPLAKGNPQHSNLVEIRRVPE